jgi:hypothetical protein
MKTKHHEFLALILTAAILGLASPAPAQMETDVPAMINYQGKLTDNLGNPVASGYYEVQFRVWSHATRSEVGDLKWARALALHVVSNGMFNVLLSDDGGLINSFNTKLLDAFNGPDRYLGLTITKAAGQTITSPAEISPRQQLVSAPFAIHASSAVRATEAQHATNATYAISAGNATTLGNLTTNDYIKTTQGSQILTGNLQINGMLGIGTAPVTYLDIKGGTGSGGANDLGAISLAYTGGGYRHFIRSRHNSNALQGNAIDFFLNTNSSSTVSKYPGNGNALAMSIDGGRVGIGQMNPDRPLTIRASGNELVSFQNSSGVTKWHLTHLSSGLNFSETGVGDGRLFLEPGGEVGIGTTTPQARLHVAGTAKITDQLELNNGVNMTAGKMNVAGEPPIVMRTYPLSNIAASSNNSSSTLVTTYSTNTWSAAVIGWRYDANVKADARGNYRVVAVRGSSGFWVLELAAYHGTSDVINISVDAMFIRKELVNDLR